MKMQHIYEQKGLDGLHIQLENSQEKKKSTTNLINHLEKITLPTMPK